MEQGQLNIVEDTANELGDKLSGRTAKGYHAMVYFGEKYVYKLTERKAMEKSTRIHAILSTSNDVALTKFIPKTILHKDLGDHSLVVEELKHGHHPSEINSALLVEINEVLKLVHNINIQQTLTDFEGDELPAVDYWNVQLDQARQFESKLKESDTLSQQDTELIEECLEIIEEVRLKGHSAPKLVTIYKDVHSMNILVDDTSRLTAIVDWDAAMSGPVELEYAILWHRYADMWPLIRPEMLDKDTFVVAGLVQGLRFWKSYTKDSKYSEQQRNALRKSTALYRGGQIDWIAGLQ